MIRAETFSTKVKPDVKKKWIASHELFLAVVYHRLIGQALRVMVKVDNFGTELLMDAITGSFYDQESKRFLTSNLEILQIGKDDRCADILLKTHSLGEI